MNLNCVDFDTFRWKEPVSSRSHIARFPVRMLATEISLCGFSGYLRRYERQQALLLSLRGTVGGDHPRSVATTFGLASERVAQEPGAADLLRACAFLHAESIPEELFEEGAAHLGPGLASLAADPYQLDRAIAALRSLSLVQRQAETRTLSLHRLVQAVVRDRMSEQEQRVWMERIIAALAAVFPQAAPQVWSQCERLLPHVLTIATSVPDQTSNQELAQVLRKAAHYLCARAHYEQAEPLYERVLRIQEQALGPAHPELAHMIFSLANLSYEQGKDQQAEPLFQRALGILEQAVGPEHPDVAYPLNGLANLFRDGCHYTEADQLYQRVLSIREQQLGQHHPLTAQTLHDLAILRHHQGQRSEARSLAERALSIRSQALGEAHPQTIATQTLSAQLVREQAAGVEPTLVHLRSLLKARGWSLHLKKRHDKPYVYATRKVGEHTQSRYLAPLSNLAAFLAAAETLPNAKEE